MLLKTIQLIKPFAVMLVRFLSMHLLMLYNLKMKKKKAKIDIPLRKHEITSSTTSWHFTKYWRIGRKKYWLVLSPRSYARHGKAYALKSKLCLAPKYFEAWHTASGHTEYWRIEQAFVSRSWVPAYYRMFWNSERTIALYFPLLMHPSGRRRCVAESSLLSNIAVIYI